MTDDKVLTKIKALLAKVDPNANATEPERDAALAKVQELLFKHGLDMAAVEAHGDDGREFIHGGDDGTWAVDDKWEVQLAHVIADVYYSRIYFGRQYRKGPEQYVITAIGRREYVSVFREVFLYVRDQIRGMAAIEVAKRDGLAMKARQYVVAELGTNNVTEADIADVWIDLKHMVPDERARRVSVVLGCSVPYARKVVSRIKNGRVSPDYVENLSVWRNSFYVGAIQRVGQRLHDQLRRQTDQAAGSTGTDMVRAEDQALARYFATLGLRTSTSRSKRRSDANGRAAGDAAGARADLGGRRVAAGTRALPRA